MKKYFVVFAVFVGALFLFYNKVYIPKHTFESVKVLKGALEVGVDGIGEVGSKEIYKIGSIFGGKVLGLDIDEGSFVQKGQLIAKVDSIDLKDKMVELKATIKKLQNDKQSALATSIYQTEILKKNKKLYKRGAISALDFQKYETNAQVAKLKASSINHQISQSVASLQGLQERFKRYTIISPISGYVVKKYISNYTIINPNQTILEIVKKDDVWVRTYIDTRLSGEIKVGQNATIKLRSSSKVYEGIVANINPINNNVTYEREIDVKFKNLPLPFYMQEQAIVKISTKKLDNVTKIPTKTIVIYKQKKGVWILKDGVVKFKAISILAYDNDFIATNDISENEKVIIPNPKNKPLSNGMKIYEK